VERADKNLGLEIRYTAGKDKIRSNKERWGVAEKGARECGDRTGEQKEGSWKGGKGGVQWGEQRDREK